MHNNLYLKQITLSNFATFELQEVTFTNSFNAIVGETGSGKSLLLDAIQLILGSRADKKLVRKGCNAATIEAIFDCEDPKIKEYFESKGYPFEENEFVIKRVMYSNGKSKSFINYQSCSLGILSDFAKRFIDLVGQFENQKLLNENYQIVLLDEFSKTNQLYNSFKTEFNKYKSIKSEISNLLTKEGEIAQKLDYINFQLNELSALAPEFEDEENLLKLKEKMLNVQERQTISNSIQQTLDGDELNQGVVDKVSVITKLISENSTLFENSDLEKAQTAYDLLSDLSYTIAKEPELQEDEVSIDEIITRLDDYQKLKRKFGTDTNGLIELLEKFNQEKELLENFNHNMDALQSELVITEKKARDLANKLHSERIKGAKKLSSELTTIIRELKMNGATISIDLNKTNDLTIYGLTELAFNAETNPGEGYFPIKQIASGGELSRILLALRHVISSDDTISIFLFDEIDTGIGGETAMAIGKSLKSVSMNSQVIAITHLPQIALFTDNIVRVSKHIINEDKEDRTISMAKQYDESQREEIIKLMNPME
jgi:DNA repair protein RecN (Recombination protein N)